MLNIVQKKINIKMLPKKIIKILKKRKEIKYLVITMDKSNDIKNFTLIQ